MRLSWILLLLLPASLKAQADGICSFPLGTDSVKPRSPRDLAGVYDLEWHQPGELISTRTVRQERLWLWRTAPTDTAHARPSARASPADTIAYPLYGTTTAKGLALTVEDSLRGLVDPLSPPVLFDARGDNVTPRLLFYTVASRRTDFITLDGGGVGATLTHVGSRTLFGEYRAYGVVHVTPGYICARRVP